MHVPRCRLQPSSLACGRLLDGCSRVSNQGIPPEEMSAVCAELKGQEGELDGLKFDVVVVRSKNYIRVSALTILESSARWRITTSPPSKP